MKQKETSEAAEKAKKLGLPTTWEDVYEMEEFPSADSTNVVLTSYIDTNHGTNAVRACLSEEDAESHLAILKLRVLRDIYRNGWKPNWSDHSSKYVIDVDGDGSVMVHINLYSRRFLSFPNVMTAYLFYENFKDLISEAKDLI